MSGSTGNTGAGPCRGTATPACPGDADSILALYRSLIGTPGTTWNEHYPARSDIDADIARGSLWCLWGEDGSLWGAASAGDDDGDIRELPCWTPAERSCELCRIGIRRDLQGQGLAERFVRFLLRETARQGRDRMRLLVSRDNPAALRLYQKLGFEQVGSCEMYGVHWLCQEKKLR